MVLSLQLKTCVDRSIDAEPAIQPESASWILRGYFHAKDENRPHLLDNVFAAHANLHMVNKAANIAFPAAAYGREAITEVLVRRFTQSYENIYSFYLDRPPADATQFSCELAGRHDRKREQERSRRRWPLRLDV